MRAMARVSKTIVTLALVLLYADAALRVLVGFVTSSFGPILSPLLLLFKHAALHPPPLLRSPPLPAIAITASTTTSSSAGIRCCRRTRMRQFIRRRRVRTRSSLATLFRARLADRRQDQDYAKQMKDTINVISRHRGKWNSWVTDTITPLLIIDNKIWLPLGPPVKDPTNYFWAVLRDLQDARLQHQAARRRAAPQLCGHARIAFARYTHFCKMQKDQLMSMAARVAVRALVLRFIVTARSRRLQTIWMSRPSTWSMIPPIHRYYTASGSSLQRRASQWPITASTRTY